MDKIYIVSLVVCDQPDDIIGSEYTIGVFENKDAAINRIKNFDFKGFKEFKLYEKFYYEKKYEDVCYEGDRAFGGVFARSIYMIGAWHFLSITELELDERTNLWMSTK